MQEPEAFFHKRSTSLNQSSVLQASLAVLSRSQRAAAREPCCPCPDHDNCHGYPEQGNIQDGKDPSSARSQDRKADKIEYRVKQHHQKETALGVVVDPGKEHCIGDDMQKKEDETDKTCQCQRQALCNQQREMPQPPEDAEQQAGSQCRLASLHAWQGESPPAELFTEARNEAPKDIHDWEGKGDRCQTKQRRDAKGDKPKYRGKQQHDRIPDEWIAHLSQATEYLSQAAFASEQGGQQHAQQARHDDPQRE